MKNARSGRHGGASNSRSRRPRAPQWPPLQFVTYLASREHRPCSRLLCKRLLGLLAKIEVRESELLDGKRLQASAKLNGNTLGRCVQTLVECRRGAVASARTPSAQKYRSGILLARP